MGGGVDGVGRGWWRLPGNKWREDVFFFFFLSSYDLGLMTRSGGGTEGL